MPLTERSRKGIEKVRWETKGMERKVDIVLQYDNFSIAFFLSTSNSLHGHLSPLSFLGCPHLSAPLFIYTLLSSSTYILLSSSTHFYLSLCTYSSLLLRTCSPRSLLLLFPCAPAAIKALFLAVPPGPEGLLNAVLKSLTRLSR